MTCEKMPSGLKHKMNMYKRLPKKIIPTVALGAVLDKTAALHKQEKNKKKFSKCAHALQQVPNIE